MPRIAFCTFGILREGEGHPQVQGFFDQAASVEATLSATTGLINWQGEGSDQHGPRFFHPGHHAMSVQTLSLWVDLESVQAFAYHGPHSIALRSRKAWCLTPAWPTYVAWWVADDHMPNWAEAFARLEELHDHGPTADAFDFKRPFDSDGRPWQLTRATVSRGV